MGGDLSGESRIVFAFDVSEFDEASYGHNMNDSGALFFVLMAGLAGIMTIVYFPLRIFLTATERSRRLRLLQRIRRLRDKLGQPLGS